MEVAPDTHMAEDRILAPQSAADRPGAARILVVDDDLTTCSFCSRALSQAGYDVISATNIPTALTALREQRPIDLLLADIQLPGMSGLELAQVALEEDPALAIIIMTGHTSIDNLYQSARRGIADFLSKPFQLDELRYAVDQALRKRQLNQETVRRKALEQLLQSSAALSAILDHRQLTQVIVARARDHVPCDLALLALVDAQGELYQSQADPVQATLLKNGVQAANHAIQQSLVLRIAPPTALCSLGDEPVPGAIVVPLRAQATTIGALLICGEGTAALSASSLDSLSLLGSQASTALHNAQLYGELQQAYQKLRELDRLKSEFIAIASHELRSPLAIVLGYTKMVRDQSAGDQRDYAQRALNSAEQVKTIVDTMLRLRDYENNQTSLSLELCSLGDLAQQSIERLAPLATGRGQKLVLKPPQPAIEIMADREKCLLILGNLVANALKFSPDDAEVIVQSECWSHDQLLAAASAAAPNPTLRHLANLPPSSWAVTQVRDNGIGIARDQQSRIFERFFQVADSLTRTHGGPGLGLALVADLTSLQDGVVWVESEEGQGSTFSFALPLHTA